ncbi:MAG: c-type cytochrome [Candidatus Eremiobacteraeota bacterium]|nr:c-type cytochrome [Candidatus Eremiobacteraeota bacterium]
MILAAAATAAFLYATHCASCHGDNGQGSNVAPSLIGKSATDIHLMLDTGRMPAAVPYVNEIHKRPLFTQKQMAALVDYIQSFSLHADPTLPLGGPGDPARGRKLFAEHCAVCHGSGAEGSSVGFANVAPSLKNATVFQVAEAIRAGPEVMPRFGPDVLGDQSVRDIARYVNTLQTQGDQPYYQDAGGISLAHVGPVAEGLIAWLFGIGMLVLFVRFTGTTQ